MKRNYDSQSDLRCIIMHYNHFKVLGSTTCLYFFTQWVWTTANLKAVESRMKSQGHDSKNEVLFVEFLPRASTMLADAFTYSYLWRAHECGLH